MAEPRAEVTQYTVTVFPEDSINRHVYDITVERRAPGRWAVCRLRECLDVNGEWDWEPTPSERDDRWKALHRFDLETALRLAKGAASGVVVNGMTAVECVELEQSHGQ